MDKADFNFDDVNSDFNLPDGDCKYFSMSQYSNILKRQKYDEVAFVHFNMRSLPKNKHKINSFLGQLPKECLPTIMAISETKLNPANVNTVEIEDYQFEHVDSLSLAGGVGIYIRKDIQYSVKPEISIDCLTVKIYLLKL